MSHTESPAEAGVSLQSLVDGMTGDGTESNPYIIKDDWELRAVEAEPSSYYMLSGDIDLSKTKYWNDSDGWYSISLFNGTLNGAGNTVTGLTMNPLDDTAVDDFGFIKDLEGTLKNIDFEDIYINVDVFTNGNIGGVFAQSNYEAAVDNVNVNSSKINISNSGGTGAITGSWRGRGTPMTNCTVTDTIIVSDSTCGLLAGQVDFNSAGLEDCHGSGLITTNNSGTQIGGLIGYLEDSINQCSSEVEINAPDCNNIGGLIGQTSDGAEISKCYVGTVDVAGNSQTGGFIGQDRGVTITDSYNLSDVYSQERAGGFIGVSLFNTVTINNSFSAGAIFSQDETNVDAFIGFEDRLDAFNNSNVYYDSDKITVPSSGVGLSTGDMQGESAISNLSGFDFSTVWQIIEQNEYPDLVDNTRVETVEEVIQDPTINWDCKNIIKTTIEDNWTAEYDITVQLKSENGGKAKRTNTNRPVVWIYETGNRGFEQADITQQTYDISESVYLSIKTKDASINQVWTDLMSVLYANRNQLNGLDGGWDYIDIDDISFKDPAHGKQNSIIRVTFIKDSVKPF